MTKAAERLNYVQSNVTARIRQLEDDLNVSLFHRKSRGVALTPVGHVFLEYTKRILSLADEAVNAVQQLDEPVGTLTIGSMEVAAVVHLPQILSEYHCQYPLVDLQLVTGTSEQVLSYVLDYSVDGAFVGGIVDHPELAAEFIMMEELVLAAAKCRHPFKNKERQTILVFKKGCCFRARLEAWLQENGILPYRIMEFNSSEAIIGCVRAGMGITFMPSSIFSSQKYDNTIALYDLPAKVAAIPINFVTRKAMSESKALDAFRCTLKERIERKMKDKVNNSAHRRFRLRTKKLSLTSVT